MAYDCSKMQSSTVHYSAWEMMNNPKITQRIDKLRAERRKASEEQRKEIEAARLLGSWNGWDAPQQLDVRQCNAMMGEIRIGFDDDY